MCWIPLLYQNQLSFDLVFVVPTTHLGFLCCFSSLGIFRIGGVGFLGGYGFVGGIVGFFF